MILTAIFSSTSKHLIHENLHFGFFFVKNFNFLFSVIHIGINFMVFSTCNS